MLIPADIEHKQFSTTRIKEGYVQEEVDDFLDRVGEAYQVSYQAAARLERENAQLRRQLDLARADAPTTTLPPVAEPPSVVAQKLLEAAEQAAQGHEADARAKADGIVRDAGGEASRLIEEAKDAADRIKSEGLSEKYRLVDELQKKIESGERAYAEIKAKADQVRRVAAEALDAHRKEFGS